MINGNSNRMGYYYTKRLAHHIHSLPSKTHLDLCKVVQGSKEDLVVDALVIWQVAAYESVTNITALEKMNIQDLGQSQLPRRVALQLNRRTEQNQ